MLNVCVHMYCHAYNVTDKNSQTLTTLNLDQQHYLRHNQYEYGQPMHILTGTVNLTKTANACSLFFLLSNYSLVFHSQLLLFVDQFTLIQIKALTV